MSGVPAGERFVLAVAVDRGKLDARESKPGDEGLLKGRSSHASGGLERGNQPADGRAHSCVYLNGSDWIFVRLKRLREGWHL